MVDIEPQKIEQSIHEARNVLAILLHRIFSRFSIEEHLNKVWADILDGKINSRTMADDLQGIINPQKNPPYKINFSHACVYAALAIDSQERNRELESWAFIAQAKYHAGLAVAGIGAYLGVDSEAVLSDRARKGGIAKEEGYDFDKREIISILSSPPVDGWCSEKEALEVVKELLSKRIKENRRIKGVQRFKLDPDDYNDFERKLKRWINIDKTKQRNGKKQGLIRLVYERNSREILMHPHEICVD